MYKIKIIDGVEYFPAEQEKHRIHIYNTTSSIEKSTYEASFGSRTCARSTQTVWWAENGPTTCPYHFENKHRKGWYPFRQRQAVCNCPDSCLFRRSRSPQIFACMPNYIVKPVLKQGACQENGEYAYESALEYVPISCICREIKKIQFAM